MSNLIFLLWKLNVWNKSFYSKLIQNIAKFLLQTADEIVYVNQILGNINFIFSMHIQYGLNM